MKQSTIAIHESQKPEPEYGAVITPIYMTSTFAQTAPAEMIAGEHGAFDYSRGSNPTKAVLENVLAKMEGGSEGFIFASGMGAMTTLVMAVLNKGDHVILGDDVYGGTFRLFDKVLTRFGIDYTQVDMTDADCINNAVTANTKMIVGETPTNPTLKLADIQAITHIAQKHNIISVIDNTFTTSILQEPLKHGADVVLYSTTKYINGHSDVVGGALIVNDASYAEKILFHQNAMGAVADPLAAWLTLRGLKTLDLRMKQHCKSARAIASFLETHKNVQETLYPGLQSHPQHDLAKTQMHDFGGMISFRMNGDADDVKTFLSKLKYFTLAESLGGVESLVEVPAVMTHASLSEEGRNALGITDTLVRLSVGIEDTDDLLDDLDQALSF